MNQSAHRPPRPEHILCAALYIDTGTAEPPRRTYSYPATGLVFAGWRHADCFTAMQAWEAGLSDEERAVVEMVTTRDGRWQGFVTSTGRYVDRAEAGAIALAAGQIDTPTDCLTSEDLY